MNLNNNKIRIVDSTMGLGITPTSRLHVFGNGTASGLLNITNDKDATKDSSVVVTSNGSFCSGTNTPSPLTKNTFVIKDDANIGITNTTWIDSTTIDSNREHENRIISANTEAYGYFGLGGATSVRSYGDLANSLYMGCFSNSKFHLLNEDYVMMTIDRHGVGIGTTIPNAALHVKDRWGGDPALTFIAGNDINQVYDSSMVVDYYGKVGIGQTTPLYKLDVFGNGGTDNLLKVSNDINSTYDSTFVIKSNGFVGIGSNTTNYPLQVLGSGDRDNVYSEYSGSYSRAAIGGRASGSDGYGIVGSASTIGAKAGLFNNYAGGTALEVMASSSSIAIKVKSGDVVVDSTRFHSPSITLPDDEDYVFPTNRSWKGEIDVDSLGYTLFTAQIRCDANGTPYLEGVSWKRWSSITYVEVGSTDGYLNITDGGSGMVITNTLGYTIKATLRFRTKQ